MGDDPAIIGDARFEAVCVAKGIELGVLALARGSEVGN
jgi:hypothetical protein